jgi:hypothetical protein
MSLRRCLGRLGHACVGSAVKVNASVTAILKELLVLLANWAPGTCKLSFVQTIGSAHL